MSGSMGRSMIIPPHVSYSKVGDEAVLLNMHDGIYYGLDAVGTRVWELLAGGMSEEQLCDTIVEEYEVDRETAARDLDALLGELLGRRLIELRGV
jgi:hypothetical protein